MDDSGAGRVLVVGGGVGGMAAALSLRRTGRSVDLVDIDTAWRAYGAGITVTWATYRALEQLGLADEVRRLGYEARGFKLRAADGTVLHETAPEEVAGIGGILRPDLHNVFSRSVLDSGVTVRLGIRPEALQDGDDGVHVRFSDGSEGNYGLLVGADGIYSDLRTRLFPDASTPKFTGQGAWRMLALRPEGVTIPEFYAAPVRIGIVPCSPTQVYLFALETQAAMERIDPKDFTERLHGLLEGVGGEVPGLRAQIGETSSIVYRPLEKLLLPLPWSKGRIVLIGDAVHATTPHLASGAGMSIEDGIALAQELEREEDLSAALRAFGVRRYERCRLVVENSAALGQIEVRGGSAAEHGALVGASMAELMKPF